ncbi:hypothetical protein [Desulfovirgula thermocuniculi]|uniref:hypothetical protein n=1 Tax=Desulfovirgula thermocuniculi TaxID=348842 RepID=UPI0004169EC2|nr:hypothetical protein [Desulfovirgula thermocuniculi]
MVNGAFAEGAGAARVALLGRMKEEALALREHLKAWLALEKEGAHEEVAAGVFSCLARLEELRGQYDNLGPAEGEHDVQVLFLLGELRDLQQENERLLAGIKEKLAGLLLEVRKARELGAYLREAYLKEKYHFQGPVVDIKG